MKRHLIYIFILNIFLIKYSNAQYQSRIEPLKLDYNSVHQLNNSNVRTIRLGNNIDKIVLDSIDLYDASREILYDTKLIKFAKSRKIDINPNKVGRIFKTSKGRYIWEVTLISRGAKNIGFHFDYFNLAKGSSLFIKNGNEIKGAYTYLNNNEYKTLQISPIKGDSVVLQYDFSDEIIPEKIPFSIDQIYHGYVEVSSVIKKISIKNNYSGEPLYNYNSHSISDLSCSPEIINYPFAKRLSRGVVLLIVGGEYIGTGSLINNTRNDGTPYILTASHVINNNFSIENDFDQIRNNCHNTVVFFNFESPIGNQSIRATEEQSLSGTELVAYDSDSDMALIKITGGIDSNERNNNKKIIPIEYRPYFNGWDISNMPNAPFYTIHHPLGATKRYSESKDKTIHLFDYSISLGLFNGTKDFYNKHWYISEWAIGTTAQGSSGCPLFQKDGLIIGTLTGGRSDCEFPYDDAFYAIKECWTRDNRDSIHSLSYWLDPDNTMSTSCNGINYDQTDNVVRLSNIAGNVSLVELSKLILPTKEINTVGSLYQLEKDDNILGAYFCFVGDSIMQNLFPESYLSVSYVEGRNVLNNIISVNIDQPSYANYKPSINKVIKNKRWIKGDTCEVYIPFPKTKVINKGNYIVCINSPYGIDKMNLLSINSETDIRNNKNIPNNSFIVNNSIIENLLSGKSSVWIDLLIERNNIRSTNTTGIDKLQHLEIITYVQGRTLVINPIYNSISGSRKSIVSIYSITGDRVLYKILPPGKNELNISDNIITGTYIVVLEVEDKYYSYKISI